MMEKNFDIEKQRVLTVKQVIAIVVFAVVATFSITGVYYRFLVMEKEIQAERSKRISQDDELRDRIEYVNDRLTRNIEKQNIK